MTSQSTTHVALCLLGNNDDIVPEYLWGLYHLGIREGILHVISTATGAESHAHPAACRSVSAPIPKRALASVSRCG